MEETGYVSEEWKHLITVPSNATIADNFAYIFMAKGLETVNAVTASLTAAIEPILNPILVAIFYKEKVSGLALVGAVIVLGTVLIYNVRQARIEDTQIQGENT